MRTGEIALENTKHKDVIIQIDNGLIIDDECIKISKEQGITLHRTITTKETEYMANKIKPGLVIVGNDDIKGKLKLLGVNSQLSSCIISSLKGLSNSGYSELNIEGSNEELSEVIGEELPEVSDITDENKVIEIKEEEIKEGRAIVDDFTVVGDLDVDSIVTSDLEIDSILSGVKKHIEDSSDKLKGQIKVRDKYITKLRSDLVGIKNKLESCEKELDNSNKNIVDLNNTVGKLKSKVIELENKIGELSYVKDNLSLEYGNYRDNSETEINRITNEKDSLELEKKALSLEVDKLQANKSEYDKETASLRDEIAELTGSKKELEESIGYLEEEINKTKKELSDKIGIITERDLELEGINSEVVRYKENIEAKNVRLDELKVANKNLIEDVDIKQKELNELKKNSDEINGIVLNKDREIKKCSDTIEVLNSKITKLEEVDKNRVIELNNIGKDISRLGLENSKLENNVKRYKALSGGGIIESNPLVDGYSGKADIINCYGYGSFGVTTIAMSIADRLNNKKVLVMDLDLSMPRCDEWDRLIGGNRIKIDEGSLKKLLRLGADGVINDISNSIYRLSRSIDLFSGSYLGDNRVNIHNVDMALLMHKLGDLYDYIVVDSGHMSQSTEQDTIIKTFCKIAKSNFMITGNKLRNVYTAKRIEDNLKVEGARSVFILNKSRTSVADRGMVDSLGETKYIILAMDMSMLGINKLLGSNPILKGKIREILKYVGS